MSLRPSASLYAAVNASSASQRASHEEEEGSAPFMSFSRSYTRKAYPLLFPSLLRTTRTRSRGPYISNSRRRSASVQAKGRRPTKRVL